MEFKYCRRPCKYSSGTPHVNGCDYLYLTGKLRGCPAGKECTKFEKGGRTRVRVDILLPMNRKLSETERFVQDYVEEQKKRIARVRDQHHKY